MAGSRDNRNGRRQAKDRGRRSLVALTCGR